MKNKLFNLALFLALTLLYVICTHANDKIKKCSLPKIKGIVNLDSECIYNHSIIIKKSNTFLNCNNSLIDGKNTLQIGINITGEIENIEVTNCNVKNFVTSGIMISSGLQITENSNVDFYYNNAPNDITINNSVIDNNGKTGVTFNSYTNNSVLKNSIIINSGGVGVYLSQSSKEITIINNKIAFNGYKFKGREGIAIDSSANNIIKDNLFDSNKSGAVFLYKNCGERHNGKHGIKRWQHSNNNLITDNIFQNEKIGVWLASRQSQDLRKWNCLDTPVDANGRFYKDYANFNTIKRNTFCDTTTGIINEGNNNYVANNTFNTDAHKWYYEPYIKNQKPDGEKSFGNIIINNKYSQCLK